MANFYWIPLLAQVAPQKMPWTTVVVDAFLHSDSIGKAIVVVLGIFSMYAWSIIFFKVLSIMASRRQCRKFSALYDRIKSPIEMGSFLSDVQGPLGNICAAGIEQLAEICQLPRKRDGSIARLAVLPRPLTQDETDKIRAVMNRQISVETKNLEEYLGLLGVFVTISPFLGLFGTVWGVMATFMAIARQGRVELSAIAPGISGALLTTVCGLLVAIPSVCANILINHSVNKTCLEMDIFVEDFIASLKLEGAKDSTEATQP
ncbi:MAG: MotA/TolQ/ExbB proton channel family protein [Victivallales bacterium]|nr:MotA/TolQ/ExbB proton channel family protein [Victivallales bacterium]